ncbi:MAG: transglycosylase SLT domain-containing protein [Pseudomonadota bacterium]
MRIPVLSAGGLYALGAFPLGMWPWPAEPPPRNQQNICAIFEEKQGLFNGWYEDAKAASDKHGLPVATIMAFMRQESAFDARARPPWKYAPKLGLVPWWTRGSDYGYGQFTDPTWDWYRYQRGHLFARRDNFADVADAIGSYARDVRSRTGTPLKDVYHQYVAYNAGPDAVMGKPIPKTVSRAAKAVAGQAARYENQLKACRRALDRSWYGCWADWSENKASALWHDVKEALPGD